MATTATNGTSHLAAATNGTSRTASIANELSGAQSMTNGSSVPNGTSAKPAMANDTSGTASATANGHPKAIPLAICGMALRLPGGLRSPQEFWDFLLEKKDARSRVPISRYNVDAYYSQSGKPGTVKSEFGYFLDESVDLGSLDAARFAISRAELERTDPHHRLMLEVARECVDDAGEVNFRGQTIGCYMGSFGEDWCEMFAKENQQYGLWRVSGFGDYMLSNRISYEMDLRGPSMTIRTGCSAGLIGLHEAALAIQRGDCTSAIVGGANLILAPGMTTAESEQGVLSPDGSSKTFSSDANGYARGEAVTALFVKPLDAAIRDGNPIRAVIRSTATNNDGKTNGIFMPSKDAQIALIKRAYDACGIEDVSQTGFMECHGTGTPAGDPIETKAVAQVFGGRGVHIGSVKPNLGHSEGASGITSIIKVALALENQTIPPNIKFSSPHPDIPFQEENLVVPTEAIPWPESRQERAGVSSFGIGGSNAHVILESARSWGASSKPSPSSADPHLLVFSAASQESLRKMTTDLQDFAAEEPDLLTDLAYTLGRCREHLPHRAFVVSSRFQPGTASSGQKVMAAGSLNLVMVFTGQGAQWPRMGGELLLSNTVFRDSIRSLDAHLRNSPDAPHWNIEEELLKPAKSSRLQQAELAQPLCTAVQVALVDAFAAIGIRPTAVVGHSSGEIAAAYASGALDAKDAIITARRRGAVVSETQTKPGTMAAVALGWDDATKFLVPGVVIACENSHKSVTLSGDSSELDSVMSSIQKAHPDTLVRKLQVDKAYHSHHMQEIGEEYYSRIKEIAARQPDKIFFSSVTGRVLEEDLPLDARYWRRNLESPVLFATAVGTILEHPVANNAVFLEVGPHSALAGPIRQILMARASSVPYVPAMLRNQDSSESFLTAIGKLFEQGAPIDFKALVPSGNCLPNLPTYPWDHQRSYWYESRLSREWRQRRYPYHDLLGVRLPESTDIEPAWRNLLDLEGVGWLRDHKVEGSIVFPGAGYMAMAGEAVRQLSDVTDEGFTIRNMIISAAMVLAEGERMEVITTFRPHRLTDSLDSHWWEFSISSYNGHLWTKHCSGQVSILEGEIAYNPAAALAQSYPRLVEPRKYYSSMDRAGINYGPSFRRLQDIQSGTTQSIARSKVTSDDLSDKEVYHLHPTLIDACLQLFAVAATNGYIQNSRKVIPTQIDSLSIRDRRRIADIEQQMFASATGTKGGEIAGNGYCVSGGSTILEFSGVKLSPLDEQADDASNVDLHAAARHEWGPHIDFLNVADLIKPAIDRSLTTPTLDELTRVCVLYTSRRLNGEQTSVTHMQKFHEWADSQFKAIESSHLASLGTEALLEKAASLVAQLSSGPAAPAAIAMQKVLLNLDDLFSGDAEPLELLLADEILTKLYNFMDECDWSGFVRALAHTKPNLRVLEIGAGTGATTASVMKHLVLPNGQPLYKNYTFTDISSGFFVAAQERFDGAANMYYRTLDISRDPAEQGFGEEEKFDLVIATNVIHATRSLHETLSNVYSLLAPDGRLLLHELNSSSKWVNYVFGTLPGWWYGEFDQRPNEPYVSVARWQSELLGAGFGPLDAAVMDSEEPHQLNAIMVARPMGRNEASQKRRRITLLCYDGDPRANLVASRLRGRGYAVVRCQVGELLPSHQDVLSLLDGDEPFFQEIDKTRFDLFKRSLASLDGSAGMMWVTQPCHVNCVDPTYAQIIGAARSIRSEMMLDLATCEVDVFASSVDPILDVFDKFQARKDVKTTLGPDYEYAIVGGSINVGRFYPFSLKDELQSSELDGRAFLDIKKPGRLASLHWAPRPSKPLEGDDVEIETYAAGLNFRDVLSALGIVACPEDGFGLEAAGIVRRIGPEVRGISPGDRVIVLGDGLFSTFVITSEKHCAKMADGLTFIDGATMPCVYATAIYSLLDIGNLQKGQSVLIHSACGGVGLAAIHLARMVGAELYVTVSSEEKVQHIMSTFGIPRNRIFHSRNTSFVEGIKRETDGKGVDLVLNSLSGELLHATWRCVAKFGKMVEIGKRDLIGAGKLDMGIFLENRSYCCVDLHQISSEKPELCKSLLEATMDYFRKGHILPIRPVKAFDMASIQDAFRYMQQGQHIGKIVVSIGKGRGKEESSSHQISISKQDRSLALDGSASYLLVGGLGGIGKAVSRYLVESGARNLVFLSRSGGQGPDDQVFVRELESMGCKVQLVQGSVTSKKEVERAIQHCSNLRGILQLSMVLRDQAFPRMTHSNWTDAVEPKIQGTWNLHNATLAGSINLDFLVLFSSMSGIIGQPGQANYSSANTFLDAFAQYRSHLGLPASVIDIGAVEDVGYISHNESLLRKMKTATALGIRERELMDSINAAIFWSPSTDARLEASRGSRFVAKNAFVLGLGTTTSLDSSESRALWKNDVRMAAYHNTNGSSTDASSGTAKGSDSLRPFVASMKADPSVLTAPDTVSFLAREIGKKLNSFLLRQGEEPSTTIPLSQLGMDSLVAIEMRSWWRQAFGFDITVLEMLGLGTLNALGQHAAEGLLNLFHGDAEKNGE